MLLTNHPLHTYNSWKVGGRAEFFCEPIDKKEVQYYLNWAEKQNHPITFLGDGTNVLISDKGIKGLVMSTKKLNSYQEDIQNNRLHITALCGVSKAKIMQIFLKHKLLPALFLCGLPGNVGGGVVMNAGIGEKDTVPREFTEIIDWIKIIKTNKIFTLQNKDIQWGYRFSKGWEPHLIYEVGMSWPIQPISSIASLLKEKALKRSRSQPLQSLSCGSVFKNPTTGEKAGFLIESAGLKNHQIGGAVVSEKHANFIVNTDKAKAMDIHLLIQHIQKKS